MKQGEGILKIKKMLDFAYLILEKYDLEEEFFEALDKGVVNYETDKVKRY